MIKDWVENLIHNLLISQNVSSLNENNYTVQDGQILFDTLLISVQKVIQTPLIDEQTAVENELATLQFRIEEINQKSRRKPQNVLIEESKVV